MSNIAVRVWYKAVPPATVPQIRYTPAPWLPSLRLVIPLFAHHPLNRFSSDFTHRASITSASFYNSITVHLLILCYGFKIVFSTLHPIPAVFGTEITPFTTCISGSIISCSQYFDEDERSPGIVNPFKEASATL